MKKFIIILVLFTHAGIAQNYVHQVFVLNEGHFDYNLNQLVAPVTIGAYTPANQSYITVDTIHGARFASDLVVDEDYFYVAADNMLYKYDKNTYNLLASHQVNGIRDIAIWSDKIIVSRGDYDNTTFSPIFFDAYLQVFNKSDLSLFFALDTITGPKWATQSLIVDGDSIYVAINNAYEWGNYKGLIGVVNMNTMSYIDEIDLGSNGINPDNMFLSNNHIYTVNNKDWTGLSISKINILNNSVHTTNIGQAPTGCGSSCIRDHKINYQISGDTLIYEWDIQVAPSSGTSIGYTNNFYDLAYDQINNLLYGSITDYSTYGFVNIYSQNNTLISSFQTGISPGTITFDIRGITNIQEFDTDSKHEYLFFDLLGRKSDFSRNQIQFHINSDGKKIIRLK